ncbi:helix-turn-helix transcriptional regulator [Streptomyces olivoreticuli]|uniref:helix-turn-helix domain-containing protein n=1 Tax=Streptomyces TaxID=1883 RepID=UPI00265B6FAA|nr:helix-turn-helix transcriptional regulator [Streptomyces olivoreticuli]WKK22676.1 helix-turn-helix transcriptional regulator [Streptomyces olivoreticuli]
MPATPTVHRRLLGAELRKLREGLGLTVDDMADRLGWHQTKVSRVETGRSGVRAHEVESVLDVYGVTDPEARDALARLAREGKRRMWWTPYSDVITPRYASYIALESDAESIRNYQGTLVPGLLQTPEYTRAVTSALQPETSPAEIDALVNVRLARQNAALRRADPLKLTAVVDEAALRRVIGGPKTMAKQLHHLLAVSEELHIDLQVLPFTAGAHAGLVGAFSILRFPVSDLDLVYTESHTSTLQLERATDLMTYSQVFEWLRAAALDVPPSRALISDVIRDLE